MYDASGPHYDRIYAKKDYEGEVGRLRGWITERLGGGPLRLLDVACGTGRHLEHLSRFFEAEGLDRSAVLLRIARARNPGLAFHEADMADFDVGRTYDVLTCLFSSIGYLTTLEDVGRAARAFHRHLVPGGLALVEPWFTPEDWHAGTVHAAFIDEPDFKLARVNTSYREGRLSFFDLHHLVGTPEKTEYFVEHHEMGLFETEELLQTFGTVGFDVAFDEEGLIGRGMLTAVRRA